MQDACEGDKFCFVTTVGANSRNRHKTALSTAWSQSGQTSKQTALNPFHSSTAPTQNPYYGCGSHSPQQNLDGISPARGPPTSQNESRLESSPMPTVHADQPAHFPLQHMLNSIERGEKMEQQKKISSTTTSPCVARLKLSQSLICLLLGKPVAHFALNCMLLFNLLRTHDINTK